MGKGNPRMSSDSELNTGYGYEMDVFSDKNNSTEKKTVYEKGYDLPVDEQENKTAKEELHEMMQLFGLFMIKVKKVIPAM